MNKIFYFTGSGNTLAIAKRFAEKLENCELVRVSTRLDFTAPVKAEKLGFVFPVYAWGIPLLFKEFMEQIQISQANYIFVITNFAGSSGNALGYFNNICKKKSIRIDAFGEVVMPSNYVTMGNADSKEDAIKVLEKAEPELRSLVDDIASGKRRLLRKPKLTSKLLTAVVYPLFTSNIRKSDKTFFSTENCIGCGICLKPNLSDTVLIKIANIFVQIELRKIAGIPLGISIFFTTSRCQID